MLTNLKVFHCFSKRFLAINFFVLAASASQVMAQSNQDEQSSGAVITEQATEVKEASEVQDAEEVISTVTQQEVADQVTPKQATPKNKAVEEITVTGSRIKRDEFNTPSPVTIITAERSALAGLLNTEDILQGSTIAAGQQIDDSFSGFVTDGGPGANTVSLRGLGAQRTLILVNGKRWGPSGVRGSVNSVDLSAIPSSVISRIEILKDGASSVYGADAVAGVINVITKERQDGFQLNAAASAPVDGGEAYSVDAIWGTIGDDWSINVAADFSRQKELVRSDRGFAECDRRPRITDQDGGGNIDNRDPITGEELCFGAIFGLVSSPFGFVRYDPSLTPGSTPSNSNFDPQVNGAFGIPFFTSVDEGPLDNQGAFYRDTRSVDVAQIVSESDVFSLTSFAEKDVTLFNRQSTAYYEFYYNQRETRANGGFQQLFPTTPATNPYNPFGTNGPLAAFGGFAVTPVAMSWNALDPNFNIEVERTNTFVGLKGDLTENWSYDLYTGYSRSSGTYENQAFLDDRVRASLDAVVDGSGNVVCRNAAAFPGCVAENWFSGEVLLNGNFSQEYLDFVRRDLRGKTTYESLQFSANATGPLFSIWGGEVQSVFGVEVRREEIDDVPDPEAQRDNIFSSSAAGITRGDDTVKEAYLELEFPFARNAPFAEELTLNIAARYTDYESFGDDITERFQFNWQINPTFRLRATNGTSFRAPDLFEQFLGNQTGFQDGFLDPCVNFGQTNQPGDPIFENCTSLGLAPDFGVNGVPGIQTITGGNQSLDAETSESTTYGIVITPEELGLSLAINYFEIELENSVASPTVSFVLGDCFGDVGFTSPFCNLIAPRNAQGNLTSIDASLLNIGVERSKGFDFDLNYSKSFDSFDLSIDVTATKLEERFRELLGEEFDFEGRWGFPEWTGGIDVYADYKDWRFLWSTNYIGSSEEEPVFDPGTTNRDRINETDDVFYHTLSARYTSPDDWQLIATVRNVFDEDPPIVSDGQNSSSATRVFNTLPGVGYDLLGRTFVLQFSKGF